MMKSLRISLGAILALAVALPASVGADSKRTICVVNRDTPGVPTSQVLNTFIYQDVDQLSTGKVISLRGLFFTVTGRKAPFDGSAVMGADGGVRLGIFVHSTAESTNNFTLSGVTDEFFAGTLGFDADGDFKIDAPLVLEVVKCDDVQIP